MNVLDIKKTSVWNVNVQKTFKLTMVFKTQNISLKCIFEFIG